MGATESCCGKREWAIEMPSAPQNPISGLRNQYVTFESGQAESFLLPAGVWRQSSSYEVHDVEGSCWFRIEGRNAASSRCKKLILNTGIHHSTMERAGNVWHVHVGGEKRVSVEKDTATQQYFVFIHGFPYPSSDAIVDLDSLNPALKIVGNTRDFDYGFFDNSTRESSSVARVTSVARDPMNPKSPAFRLQVASNVDVAMILLTVIAIDSSEHDPPEKVKDTVPVQQASELDSNRNSGGADRLKGAKSSKTPPQSPLKTPKSPAVTVPKLWQDGKEQKEDVASKLDFASPHSGGAHV